jgi:hypothetical protein
VAAPERLIGLARQADVDLAGTQSLGELRHVQPDRIVVPNRCPEDVDAIPTGRPRRPEVDPAQVVQKVAVHRGSPVEDRADTRPAHQDVPVHEVGVDQVARLREIGRK